MKRALFIFLIIFIVMQFIRPDRTNIAVEKSMEIQTPVEVTQIFQSACYDCHSNETRWPWYSEISPFAWVISNHVTQGRKALNFSIWENYSEEEKKEHLKDIYRTVYAAMPLPSYIYAHEEADLSKEQRTMIRNWTGVRPK